jgi:hypothetical protein
MGDPMSLESGRRGCAEWLHWVSTLRARAGFVRDLRRALVAIDKRHFSPFRRSCVQSVRGRRQVAGNRNVDPLGGPSPGSPKTP